MTHYDKTVVLCHVRDLDCVQDFLRDGYRIAAGTAHIAHELRIRRVDYLCLSNFVSDDLLSENLDQAWRVLEAVCGKTEGSWPADLRSAVLTKVAKALLAFYFRERLRNRLETEIYYTAGDALDRYLPIEKPVPLSAAPAAPEYNLSAIEGPGVIWGREYRLDFRSLSGKQLPLSEEGLINIAIKPSPGKKSVSLHRIALRSAWKQRTFRPSFEVALDVPKALVPDCVERLDLSNVGLSATEYDYVLQTIQQAATGFSSYRAAMAGFLKRNGLPRSAILNHVRDEGLAGFASALHETNVECRLYSHGALMSYGNTPRHKIVDTIGAGHFNSAPSMSHLVPRSPLQVQKSDNRQMVEKLPHVTVLANVPTENGSTFKLYYAPNFLPWPQNLWGISPSCFDTVRCIEKFCAVVADISQIELFLRIKTTTRDTAQKGRFFENRGLYPQDVQHVLDPSNGIIDASFGSHKTYLENADLVVTEGLTSVMFDALEGRKPVLLLNRSALVVPSMPAWSIKDLLESDGRAAVYAASLDDPLRKVIETIHRKHKGRPLVDKELERYVWLP
ncbi:hypothetical protein FIV00_00330 [Labrenzia sp. THAF82]|nr:hypothetical protein FIV00_00330 [Labrenzia sp. THAF82]